MCELYFAYHNSKAGVSVCMRARSSPLLSACLSVASRHTAFPLCAVRACVWVMVECWWWVWAVTDACDRQMVFVVVSLITATRLGREGRGLSRHGNTNRRQIYPRLPLTHFFCLLFHFYIFHPHPLPSYVRREREPEREQMIQDKMVFWEEGEGEDKRRWCAL